MRKLRATVSISCLALLTAAPAMAAGPGGPLDWLRRLQDSTLVRCEAKGSQRVYCKADTTAGIVLLKQRSKAPCERGKTWDADAEGLWVEQGCRADFRLGEAAAKAAEIRRKNAKPAQAPVGIIRCDSQGARWNHCLADVTQPIVMRWQLSTEACIRSQSWGTDANGIWVSGGCRAEFHVGHPNAAASPGGVVSCDSIGGGRKDCAVNTGRGVVLMRQRSNLRCVRDQSWGFDDGGVWVSRGCRADFLVNASPEQQKTTLLRCESMGGREKVCAIPAGRKVRLRQQLSNSPCRQGENWEVKPDGLHVRMGCRADFVID